VKSLFCIVACLLTAAHNAWPAEALPESFETGIPDYVTASRPGTIHVSDAHSKHGMRSLRWDWQAGDTLVFAHGLGNIRRQGGYGGTYSKSTFGVWLYSAKPGDGEIVFRFRRQASAPANFRFPLGFSGWRRAHLRYSWRPQFEGRVLPDTDSIELHAPDTGTGTVFIDLLTYNGILDYRQQYVPKAKRWQRPVRDPAQFPVPELLSEAEREGLAAVAARFQAEARGNVTVNDNVMVDLEKAVAEWRVERTPDGGIRGRPIVMHPGFYTELGLTDVDGPAAICKLMLRLAQAHANCTEPDKAARLAESYLLLADHIHDQGMTVGAGFGWGWYNGRDLATATFLMRDVLRDAGKLQRDADYFDANYGFSRIFDDSTIRPNMDYFHNDMRNIIRGALMQPNDAERVRCLRAVARRLTKDILYQGHDGFRPDGSTFHHGMHYFAYGDYSMNTLCALLSYLAGTPYQVSDAALTRVRRAVLNMRFYCNFRDLPLPLCGRHPHRQALGTHKLYNLAVAAAPAPGKLDADLARAYLRFAPEKVAEEPFAGLGLTPEPHPQGTLSMPHAGLLAIRKDHWLAVIKGYSRYVRFGEIYASNNRFGRYLSHGYLDVLARGNPVTRAESGCVPDGWDWNRLDGTTVIVLPEDKLRAVSRGTEGVPTDEVFCGAATGENNAAVFGLKLHGAEKHDASFHARKSYHWLPEPAIFVCLGTAIACADADNPVQTTLFQKALTEPGLPIVVSGESVTDLEKQCRVDQERVNWLLDTQNTGYIIPAGQHLAVTRAHQTFRDQHDKKDAEGDFACAWLDHGTAPRDRSYHYAVIPNADAAELGRSAHEWQNSAPYRVVRQDAAAHAVLTVRPAERLTAAFFAPATLDGAGPLPSVTVSKPCLVIVEKRDSGLVLSVTDPDLRLDSNYVSQPGEIVVTLAGNWQISNGTQTGAVRREDDPAATEIALTCRDGMPVRVSLVWNIGGKN
jgi:chondroitin-sulfate-ABC endolyase/exolyase